jgi:hypothetical protein
MTIVPASCLDFVPRDKIQIWFSLIADKELKIFAFKGAAGDPDSSNE